MASVREYHWRRWKVVMQPRKSQQRGCEIQEKTRKMFTEFWWHQWQMAIRNAVLSEGMCLERAAR